MKRIIYIVLAAVVLTLVPATYASAQGNKWKRQYEYREGLSIVRDANGKYGFVDKKNKLVIPCKWKLAYNFHEGMSLVKDANGKYGFIDKTGKIVE